MGFSTGPVTEDQETAVSTKWRRRILNAVGSEAPALVNVATYSVKILTGMLYKAQLCHPSTALLRAELNAIMRLLRRPGRAMSLAAVRSLKKLVGVRVPPLLPSCLAATARYSSSSERWCMPLARLLQEERGHLPMS